mgnify:CR=1 FL=1
MNIYYTSSVLRHVFFGGAGIFVGIFQKQNLYNIVSFIALNKWNNFLLNFKLVSFKQL